MVGTGAGLWGMSTELCFDIGRTFSDGLATMSGAGLFLGGDPFDFCNGKNANYTFTIAYESVLMGPFA